MRKNLAAIAACAALMGCAGFDQAMTYSGIDPVHFDSGDATWRIFDKPAEGKLMITPTLGNAMGQGVLKGLTFGAADTDIPKSQYQGAVEAWLKHTGRSCTIIDGYKIIQPQWEFTYRCAEAPHGSAPVP